MQILYWLESIRNPVLDGFFSLITHLGSETLFIAVAIVVFWCVGKKEGYYLMTVGFFGTVINQFLKLLFRIPRPWVLDPEFTIVEAAREGASGYSFPSGHTQSVVGVMGCPARFTRSKGLRIVCIVLIALTALSRMYLGVHTPLDVGVSLVIGTALVLVLWPIFRDSDSKPRRMMAVMAGLSLFALAYVLYVELYPWGADVDQHNLTSGIKNAYTMLGCSLGVVCTCLIESRCICFDTRAPLTGQIAKTVVGLALVLGLKAGLKPLCLALFGGHVAATALRYFLLVLFAGCLWPLTFPWFAKGCPMPKKMKKALKIVAIVIATLAVLAGYLFWEATRDTSRAPIETDGATNSLITPLGETMLSGHRSGGGIAPENTLMAFKNCVESTEYQLDIFEFDIHLTKDGIPVLIHDSTLDRTSDAVEIFGHENVKVGEKTLAELKQLNMGAKFKTDDGKRPFAGLKGDAVPDDLRITTLDEALTYLEQSGEHHYIIEIKNSGETGYKATDILYDTLVKFGALERTVVGTFHNEITAYMDEKHPDMLRSAGVNECIKFFICSIFNWPMKDEAFPYVALQIPTTDYTVNMGTSRVVNYAHKHNIAVQYWTINDPAEMARLQSIGADAIMTDVPDQAGVLVQPK